MSPIETDGWRRPSVVGHFRVWKDVYESLEEEARAHSVSLNTVVNQVLSLHAREDALHERVGFVRMPKELFRAYLRLMPDDKLTEPIMETLKSAPVAIMMARSGSITPAAILNELRDMSTDGWFSMEEVKGNGKRVSLMHDFGPRFSVCLSAEVSSLFGLIGVHPKITTADSSVTFEY